MKKLLTILCLVLLSSYSYSEEVLYDTLVEREGVFYKENSTTPFTGTAFQYYPIMPKYGYNGELNSIANFVRGKTSGKQEVYYPNGQLLARQYYKNGEPNGLFVYYHEDGLLSCRSNYKNGRKEGLSECYYENGQLKSRGNYKNGLEQ